MSSLTILKTTIRKFDNLHSLNDLHFAAGGEAKHKPSNFIRLDTTVELIEAIKADSDREPVKVIRGTNGGTYVCEELVLSYAMWISPKFHLIVLRAFLAMHKAESQNANQIQPLVEHKYTFEFTEYELEQLVWLWCSHSKMNTLLVNSKNRLRQSAHVSVQRFTATTTNTNDTTSKPKTPSHASLSRSNNPNA